MSLEDYYNKYDGERIVLVGNGPSLSETSMDKLTQEYTFAVNNINPVYERTDWRPDFYLYHANTDFVQQTKHNLNEGSICFVSSKHKNNFNNHESLLFIRVWDLVDKDNRFDQMSIEEVEICPIDLLEDYWSYDITEGVYEYHSMYIMMQIAIFMGFSSIYFIGCDLGYNKYDPHMVFENSLDPLDYTGKEKGKIKFVTDAVKGGTFFKSITNGLVHQLFFSPLNILVSNKYIRSYAGSLSKEDSNHFTADYLSKPADGRKVNQEMQKAHLAGNRIANKNSVDMYNATIGGQLERVPRVDFDSIF